MNSFIINRLFFQLFSSWCSLNVTSRCCFFLNSFQFVHIWSEVTEIGHSWCFFFYKEKTPNKKPLCLVHSTSVNALERAASSHCWFSLWSEVGSGFFSTERGHLWTFQHEISFSTGGMVPLLAMALFFVSSKYGTIFHPVAKQKEGELSAIETLDIRVLRGWFFFFMFFFLFPLFSIPLTPTSQNLWHWKRD